MSAGPVPHDSIVALLQALVRIPSRAALDASGPVQHCIEAWLASRHLPMHQLHSHADGPLGVYAEVRGDATDGPWTVLDATLDTAGFGDVAAWARPPTDGGIDDGWLHGRGSADSKVGVALFAHLLASFAQAPDSFAGRLGVLFDLDEHSGAFGGARAFFDRPFAGGSPPRPDHVFIGYPGLDRIVTGGRGFLRARLSVHGIGAHSGASRQRGVNAIGRAGELAQRLAAVPLPRPADGFALPPQLTLTGMHAGDGGFSQVPDRCELSLDLRLTPSFGDPLARSLVESLVRTHDAASPELPSTAIEWIAGWPAYQVADDSPMVMALRAAGRVELGSELPTSVAGPSNIGNYLASLGVPALCGFGARGENIHAVDERVDLASIAPAYRIYRGALQALHRR